MEDLLNEIRLLMFILTHIHLDSVYTLGTVSLLSLMPIWCSCLKCMNHSLLL